METKIRSVDAATGHLLREFDVSSREEILRTMDRSAEAAIGWRRVPIAKRIEVVQTYSRYLSEHRDTIKWLICREAGKLPWDSDGEVSASIAKIELSISALRERGGDYRSNDDSGPVARRVLQRPLGTVLVLGPFNFPLHLPGGQIIPALLAGNSVVFKPSEITTAVGNWMVRAWHESGLPEDVLQMIVGASETASIAIDCPQTKAVFLTGSRSAGQSIHRRLAGRASVLLALELGGNNPIVVLPDTLSSAVADLVSFSAFVSAGQRCTCARRVIFAESDHADSQLEALIQKTASLRMGLPEDNQVADVGPLISVASVHRLKQSYDALIRLGCKPLIAWTMDDRHHQLVRPVILDADGLSWEAFEAVGQMEWFGPMLVVRRAKDFDGAINAARQTSYGLAASLLGGTREEFERFAAEVPAGVVNWNGPTTGAAGNLPFGGVGDSGNHRPAGYFAIDSCRDPVASLQRELPPTEDPWNISK